MARREKQYNSDEKRENGGTIKAKNDRQGESKLDKWEKVEQIYKEEDNSTEQ